MTRLNSDWNIVQYFEDLNILKLGDYSNGYFEYITKKYSNDEKHIFDILGILFDKYSYPLKTHHRDIEIIFDYILYFSLYHYKHIIINSKTFNTNEILHPNINNIIPNKIKNIYINLLKVMIQLIL